MTTWPLSYDQTRRYRPSRYMKYSSEDCWTDQYLRLPLRNARLSECTALLTPHGAVLQQVKSPQHRISCPFLSNGSTASLGRIHLCGEQMSPPRHGFHLELDWNPTVAARIAGLVDGPSGGTQWNLCFRLYDYLEVRCYYYTVRCCYCTNVVPKLDAVRK